MRSYLVVLLLWAIFTTACESKFIGKKIKATAATEAAKKTKKTKKQNREVVVATIETKIGLRLLKDEYDPTEDVLTIVGGAIVSALGKQRRKLQGGYRYLLEEIRITNNWDNGSVINVSTGDDCGQVQGTCAMEVRSTILQSEKSLKKNEEEALGSSGDIDEITTAIESIESNGSITITKAEVVKVKPSSLPSSSPSAPPSSNPTQSCRDNPTFRTKNSEGESCDFIGADDNNRSIYCGFQGVIKNCPQACRLCCDDDEDFRFERFGELRDCEWLSTQKQNNRQKICLKIFITNKCGESCGRCAASTTSPTQSPTSAPKTSPPQSPTSTPTTSPTQSPTTSPTDTDAPRATYIPYNDDPLKDTAIADFNKAVGQDPTSTDPYYAWCNLLGCPQFNAQAESWCIDGGQSACRNQCAALPGGSEPDNGVNRVCTRYGAPVR